MTAVNFENYTVNGFDITKADFVLSEIPTGAGPVDPDDSIVVTCSEKLQAVLTWDQNVTAAAQHFIAQMDLNGQLVFDALTPGGTDFVKAFTPVSFPVTSGTQSISLIINENDLTPGLYHCYLDVAAVFKTSGVNAEINALQDIGVRKVVA